MPGDVTTEELASRLGEADLVLVDVRSAEEFSGLLAAPCDPRAGHITGARRLDLAELLGAADVDAVRTLVGEPVGTEVVAYCHTGARSAVAVQILVVAGYDARNYPGSWHEWSRDPALPAETGS